MSLGHALLLFAQVGPSPTPLNLPTGLEDRPRRAAPAAVPRPLKQPPRPRSANASMRSSSIRPRRLPWPMTGASGPRVPRRRRPSSAWAAPRPRSATGTMPRAPSSPARDAAAARQAPARAAWRHGRQRRAGRRTRRQPRAGAARPGARRCARQRAMPALPATSRSTAPRAGRPASARPTPPRHWPTRGPRTPTMPRPGCFRPPWRGGRASSTRRRAISNAPPRSLPRDPQVGLEAGVIAVLSGRDDAARKSWQSVIAAAPDSDEAKTAHGLSRAARRSAQRGPAAAPAK